MEGLPKVGDHPFRRGGATKSGQKPTHSIPESVKPGNESPRHVKELMIVNKMIQIEMKAAL